MSKRDMRGLDKVRLAFFQGFLKGLAAHVAEDESGELWALWEEIHDEIWNGNPNAKDAFPGLGTLINEKLTTRCMFDKGE